MPESGVWIETLENAWLYSPAQIEYAAVLAARLDRGKLLLVEPPANSPDEPEPST